MVDNRRIGERIAVGATSVTWERVCGRQDGPSREADFALVMDLSVTGLGLFGPSDPQGRVEDLYTVGFNHARAVVEIRRVSLTDKKDVCYYGVEFVALERPFELEVHKVIGRWRDDHPTG